MMNDYAFTNKNCWEVYGGAKDAKALEALAKRYMDFLSACKTERETVEYAMDRLAEAGFADISESRKNASMADKVMRQLQGKTLFVARRGKTGLSSGLHMVLAHADAPRLDLKQHPLQEQAGVAQAKTHYYGGIRKYQWFARPLALHGVVVKENGEKVRVNIGDDAGDPVFAISDLLPHLAQGQQDQPLRSAFEAEKMNIILGHKPEDKPKGKKDGGEKNSDAVKSRVLNLLNEKYGIIEEDLYSAELQAVPAGPAREVGLDRALIGSYAHDDRINVFLAVEAMLEQAAKTPEHTQVVMLLDKEEIGSEGSTGAKSKFFEYCVRDLINAWDGKAEFSDVMLNTRALSADVHAATDPDWQDLHEKLNSALVGQGPCFCKFTGSRGKYEANDAHPEYFGWLRGVLNKASIPWQMAELGKVDTGGGGTVAMYFASYGMNIIDCGPAILSMHSPFELASKADLYATKLAFTAFLHSK